jgi:response regulator RpfG family c-di-GMP phosphodiesterase
MPEGLAPPAAIHRSWPSEEDPSVRPYLKKLLERMGDKTPYISSADSISWAATREAEKLTDISMVGGLAAAVSAGVPTDKRKNCYFTIGKIGANLGGEDSAAVLLSLLPGETDKYNLATPLHGIGKISRGSNLDLSPVFPLLADSR